MSELYFVERSPDYLEHHGILGQKWGIRRFQNPDGSLTSQGIERYRSKNKRQVNKIKEEYTKMFNTRPRDEKSLDNMFKLTGASTKTLSEVHELSKTYGEKLDKMNKEADTLFNDFDEETRTFYEASSELAENSLYYSRDPKDSTLEDIGNAGFMGCLEDGQQQSVNANSMYANEKGIVDECSNIGKEYDEAWDEYHYKTKEIMNDAFENVGANIQLYPKNPNFKLGDALTNRQGYAVEANHKGEHFYQAIEGGYKFNNEEQKAIDSAKEIIGKVDGNTDYNTWWYFNEAAENLGMSNIKASEMTQSDWDKLNAEIRDLRSTRHSAMTEDEYLEHHGILGQKWGIRRFQNPDGSLTEEGRKRYGDILTPDQMKNMIKSYNLRTGKNKKINKNTTFKTSHGTYDYKGKRIDTDVDVNDPGNENKKVEYDSKKDPSKMTDEELDYAIARQKAERIYKEEYAKNNPTPPEKVSTAKQMIDRLRNDLVTDIPDGLSIGLKNYLARSIANLADANYSNNSNNSNKSQQSQPQQQEQQPKKKKQKQQQSQPQQQEQQPKEQKPKESIKDKLNKIEIGVEKTAEKAGNAVDNVNTTVKNTVADAKAAYEKGRNANYNNRVNLLDSALKDLGYTSNSGAANMARSQLERVARNGNGRQYDTKEFYKTNANNIIRGYYEARAAQMASDLSLKTLDQIPQQSSSNVAAHINSISQVKVSDILEKYPHYNK